MLKAGNRGRLVAPHPVFLWASDRSFRAVEVSAVAVTFEQAEKGDGTVVYGGEDECYAESEKNDRRGMAPAADSSLAYLERSGEAHFVDHIRHEERTHEPRRSSPPHPAIISNAAAADPKNGRLRRKSSGGSTIGQGQAASRPDGSRWRYAGAATLRCLANTASPSRRCGRLWGAVAPEILGVYRTAGPAGSTNRHRLRDIGWGNPDAPQGGALGRPE